MLRKTIIFSLFVILPLIINCSCERKTNNFSFPNSSNNEVEYKTKPCFIWIDAAANFPDFANSKENIIRDLKKAAEVGFTHVVVDIRPTSGYVLFKSSHCEQLKWVPSWNRSKPIKIERTTNFDYLQVFIDEGHKLGLKVYAGFNTFIGGRVTTFGNLGPIFDNPKLAECGTVLNTAQGLKNIMETQEYEKFYNPANPYIQNYIISLLKDLAKYNKTGLDGIILDRCRFMGYRSDFSDFTRQEFEQYIGHKVDSWPEDVLPIGYKEEKVPRPVPKLYLKWNEYRVKVIYDFMYKARKEVKAIAPDLDFGAYVGAWYAMYFPNGVNWASKKYDPSIKFPSWASKEYKNYGYASLMDILIVGAYAKPVSVYGSWEWSMQGFCKLAMDKTKGDAGLLVGGPDVGNWDYEDKYTQQQENDAITNSVKACADQCQGYFLFDMIHLKIANQWGYVKQGIDQLHKK